MKKIPRLAITMGEPAGIGPDIVIAAAQRHYPAKLIAVGDKNLLIQRAKQLHFPLQINDYDPKQTTITHQSTHLSVLHIPLQVPCTAGQLNPQNATYVLNTLERAANGVMQNEFDAIVTGPIHKACINDAGIPFSGHTEFFARHANCKKVVMMLATSQLRVALVTTHLPLKQVSQAITVDELENTLLILHHDLIHYFGIQQPRILVAGLNPHAGEQGHIGREEIDVIIPVLEKLRRQHHMHLIGPLGADTLFTADQLAHADAALAMYHDQGLPVLKHAGFGHAVNITLGLPFIRTSVDHGTALSLAGTGKASADSLHEAIMMGIMMAEKKFNI